MVTEKRKMTGPACRLSVHAQVLLAVVLFACVGLAGCAAPPHEPQLLREAVTVGPRLYGWSDDDFHSGGPGPTRRIAAEFTVPEGVMQVGIGFTGGFRGENSTATLEVMDQADTVMLVLNATRGRPDDLGPIEDSWRFQRSYGFAPGTYVVRAVGSGWIGQLEFRVHGIESGEAAIERSFAVRDGGRDVEVRVLLDGWGRVPAITLRGPDDTATALPVERLDGQAVLTFAPDRGTYTLAVDTTGYGGRLFFDVQQP